MGWGPALLAGREEGLGVMRFDTPTPKEHARDVIAECDLGIQRCAECPILECTNNISTERGRYVACLALVEYLASGSCQCKPDKLCLACLAKQALHGGAE